MSENTISKFKIDGEVYTITDPSKASVEDINNLTNLTNENKISIKLVNSKLDELLSKVKNDLSIDPLSLALVDSSFVVSGNTYVGCSTDGTLEVFTGDMEDHGFLEVTPSTTVQTFDHGYYEGISVAASEAPADLTNLKAENIKYNVTINGVTGTYEGESTGGTGMEFYECAAVNSGASNEEAGPLDLVISNARYYAYSDGEVVGDAMTDDRLSTLFNGVWVYDDSSTDTNRKWVSKSDPQYALREELNSFLLEEEGVTVYDLFLEKNGDNVSDLWGEVTYENSLTSGNFDGYFMYDASYVVTFDASPGADNSDNGANDTHTWSGYKMVWNEGAPVKTAIGIIVNFTSTDDGANGEYRFVDPSATGGSRVLTMTNNNGEWNIVWGG